MALRVYLVLGAQACVQSIVAREDALSIILLGSREKSLRPNEYKEIFESVYGKAASREAGFTAEKMRVMVYHLKRSP